MSFITPSEFKERFPEFASVADGVVETFIDESDLYVDALWPEPARALAQGLYVAHTMKLDGHGSSATLGEQAQAISAVAGVAGVTKFRIDDLEVGLSDKLTEQQLGDPLASTQYGRRFIELRRKYFGGGATL